MKIRFRALCLLGLLLSAATAASQTKPTFDPVTVRTPSGARGFRALLQDHMGFIWIGANGQILRHDGYEWQAFDLGIESDTLMSAQSVTSLAEDGDGNLWIGTSGAGLYRYGREDGRIDAFRHDPADNGSLSSDWVFALQVSAGGEIWVGTGGLRSTGEGLDRLDPTSGRVTRYQHDPDVPTSLAEGRISALLEDRSGRLWVGTGTALNLMDPSTGHCVRYLVDQGVPGGLSGGRVVGLETGKDNELWVISQRTVSRWEGGSGGFTTLWRWQKNSVLPSAVASDGTLWVGGEIGLCALSPSSGERVCWPNGRGDSTRNNPGYVASILGDRSGMLWATTFDERVMRWDPAFDRREAILLPESPLEASLRGRSLQKLHRARDGDIWAISENLDRDLPPGPLVTRGRKGAGRVQEFLLAEHDPEQHIDFNCFGEDPRGELWIGTWEQGLLRIDRESGKLFRAAIPDLQGIRMTDLTFASSGELWIASWGPEVYRYQPESGTLTQYTLGNIGDGDNRSIRILEALVDSRGRVWLGTRRNGVHLYHPEEDTFHRLSSDDHSLAEVGQFLEDRRGQIWATTNGGGLHRLDPDLGSADRLTTADGLPSDSLFHMVEDSRGRLWIIDDPIVRLDTESRSVRTFSAPSAVPMAAHTSAEISAGDTILIGTTSGLYELRIEDSDERHFSAPLAVTGIEISGHPVAMGAGAPLDLPTEFDLSHDQNNLSITVAALDFLSPERNLYAHMLEGIDADWRKLGARRTVDYTNLDPGEYVYRALGTNSHGIWSEHEVAIHISIRPPWWGTWWAYTAFGLILMATAAGVVAAVIARERLRAQVRIKESEAEHLAELDTTKSRFFANISHEFRTPLTLICGPLEDLLNEPEAGTRETFDLMSRNARRLLELVDQLLDLSKLEAGQLRLQVAHGDPVAIVREVVGNFQSLAEQKEIDLRFHFPEGPVSGWCDRDALHKVMANLVGNALKFTPEGGTVEITCRVSAMDPSSSDTVRLIVAVRDSGPGIDEADLESLFDRFFRAEEAEHLEGTGIGLALVRELVELHGGHIDVASEPGAGTTFKFELPIDEASFAEDRNVTAADAAPENRPSETAKDLDEEAEELTDAEEIDDGRPVVLVVEDNCDLRTYISSRLADSYQVIEAGTGTSGLDVAIERVPDLIVSDVMMPEMDGFELCTKLKHDERTSHVPVILLTARSGVESTVEGLEAGADNYMVKPFDSRELRVRIRNLIEQRQLLRERFSGQQVLAPIPPDVEVTSLDDKFLRKVSEALERRYEDPDLTVEAFAGELFMSRMQLHRKLKALTGMSATEFIRTYRLRRAAQLLAGGAGNVTEVAYAVGFKNQSHFSWAFKQEFDVSPSAYLSNPDA